MKKFISIFTMMILIMSVVGLMSSCIFGIQTAVFTFKNDTGERAKFELTSNEFSIKEKRGGIKGIINTFSLDDGETINFDVTWYGYSQVKYTKINKFSSLIDSVTSKEEITINAGQETSKKASDFTFDNANN